MYDEMRCIFMALILCMAVLSKRTAVSGTGRVNDADRSKFDRGCALRNDTAAEPVKINIHSNPGDSCFGQRPLRSPLFLTYTSFSPPFLFIFIMATVHLSPAASSASAEPSYGTGWQAITVYILTYLLSFLALYSTHTWTPPRPWPAGHRRHSILLSV